MKRLQVPLLSIVCLLLIFCINHNVQGTPIDKDTAGQVGEIFSVSIYDNLLSQSSIGSPLQTSKIATIFDESGNILAYVLNLSPEGFIIVSADTDIKPIIAYSLKGKFSFSNRPDNVLLDIVKWDMKARIEALPFTPQSLKKQNSESWEQLLSGNVAILESGEAMIKTRWHQGDPFNRKCPKYPSSANDTVKWKRSLVGCSAVAVAQLLNYYEYPKSIRFGTSDRYVSNDATFLPDDEKPREIIRIDYDPRRQDLDFPSFSQLNTVLSNINYKNEAIRPYLCFAAGISLYMNYGTDKSGAPLLASVFRNKFGYESADLICANDNPEVFYDLLKSNLESRKPAIIHIRGNETSGLCGIDWRRRVLSGHTVLVDGVNSFGQYHLICGLEEHNDTWYSLPEDLPKIVDKDGESYGYKTVFEGILNISPPKSKPSLSSFQINGGASSTESRTITLNNTTTGNPTEYMASESSNFSGANWQQYSTAPAFTILSAGNGTKRVYFKVRNSAGESNVGNDTISLAEVTTGAVRGRLHENSVSGPSLSGAKVSCDGKSTTTGSDGTFRLTGISDGSRTITFSKSGYQSYPLAVTISKGQETDVGDRYLVRNPAKPSLSSFQINGGVSSTKSRDVTLNNSASGNPTEYMASESSRFSGGNWKPYSAAPRFTLSSGNGTKTVYLKLRNSAGESAARTDTIKLAQEDKPDLAISDLVIHKPGESAPADRTLRLKTGEKFEIEIWVTNRGKGDAKDFEIRYYRSNDETIEGSDRELEHDDVSLLKAGEVHYDRKKDNIAAPDTPGTYYIGAGVHCDGDANPDNDFSRGNEERGIIIVEKPADPPNTGILIYSPKYGAVWESGWEHDISWTSILDPSENLWIEFSLNGGATWHTISESAKNDGNRKWNFHEDKRICQDAYPALIRISGNIHPEIYGLSHPFTVDHIAGNPDCEKPDNWYPEGGFDGAGCDVLTGWARDPSTTDPISIHVYVDGDARSGRFLGATLANLPYRGKNCGFSFPLPAELSDGWPHELYVYALDSAGGHNPILNGSPRMITCGPPPPMSIKITNPGGGENWRSDEPKEEHHITWITPPNYAGEHVRIEYRLGDQAPWNIIEASTPNDGSRYWYFGDDHNICRDSDRASIRISSVEHPEVSAISNVFTIDHASGYPDCPANHLPQGSIDSATCDVISGWARDPDSVLPITIHIYSDGLDPANRIAIIPADINRPDLPYEDKNHGFSFLLPDHLKDGWPHTYYIYALDSEGGSNPQLSGSPKTITCGTPPPMSITITSPSTTSVWESDREHHITWNTHPFYAQEHVKVEYSLDNGYSWHIIEASTPNDGSRYWYFGEDKNICGDTNAAKIRITGVEHSAVSATSDPFSIDYIQGYPTCSDPPPPPPPPPPTPAMKITVTFPIASSVWESDREHHITWTSEGLSGSNHVWVSFSLDDGASWNTIEASTPNDGSRYWYFGDDRRTCHDSAAARIKISCVEQPGVVGISERFTIDHKRGYPDCE